ncbi:uncharacterized protein LOC134536889 isoform X1 [Bacillus rossius redtenbacheri]|uniref:uncharacterized protein LOC134536889 isoform X1 n=1 Tax=Bacillus rossius redtenbacheri TaxID=93214 RepID=UPI002FDD58BB
MAARKRVRYTRKTGLLQRLLPCYPWRRKRRESGDGPAVSRSNAVFPLVPVSPAECQTLEVVLSTWPNHKLAGVIESAVTQANAVTNASVLAAIEQAVVAELDEKLPMLVDEQFDFCVVSAEIDCLVASEFAKDVASKFNLLGFFVEEVMGQDKFSSVMTAIQKSTKVVFYITEHFVADEFCSHLVRNTVGLPCSTNIAARIVPVLQTPEIELPAALRIINKVVLSNPTQFEFVMPRIFNCEVRRQTQERKAARVKAIDEQRREMVVSLVQHKLGVFV